MHLCLVSNEYPPMKHGGIGSCNFDLAEGMVRAGHKVTVVGFYRSLEPSMRDQPVEVQNGVKVVRLLENSQRLPYKLAAYWNRMRLSRWLRKEHARQPFDILEYSDYAGWLPWGGPSGVPSIVRLHGTNLLFDAELGRTGDPFEYALERKTLQCADYWLGVSQFAFDRTLAVCGLQQQKGGVIYNAVDTDVFSPTQTPVERGLIVFVNSINQKKGVEELMEAANIVLLSHPYAKLVMIGSDAGKKVGGKTYIEFLKSRLKPEVRERVVFTGRLDRYDGVLPYLRKAHVCCYPSHAEMFAIAPLEAMAVGKPTIFTKNGAGAEAIEDSVSGFLCTPTDPQDIASKIAKLLDDSEIARMVGTGARERILQRFNKADWVPKNIEFFEQCIASKKSK